MPLRLALRLGGRAVGACGVCEMGGAGGTGTEGLALSLTDRSLRRSGSLTTPKRSNSSFCLRYPMSDALARLMYVFSRVAILVSRAMAEITLLGA